MTRVRVKYLGNFRYVTEKEEETLDIVGNTVEDVVNELGKRYGDKFLVEILEPETRKLLSNFVFLLNGNNVLFLGGLEAKVKDEDSIAFVAMVGGG
jgi:MoaD family protein